MPNVAKRTCGGGLLRGAAEFESSPPSQLREGAQVIRPGAFCVLARVRRRRGATMEPVTVEIRRLDPADRDLVRAAGHLFDDPPTPAWTDDVLRREGHHLLFAFDDGVAVGFVTCVEMAHPDKGVEVFLYELGVDEAARGLGIGRRLVEAALDLARDLGGYGAWTITEDDNEAALATYRSAGATADPTSVTETWDWRDG